MSDEIKKMLQALSQAKKKAGEEVDEDSMTDEELVRTMRKAFEDREEKHKLVPGQVVVHKYPHLANTVDAHRPGIFVRYISPKSGRDLPGANPEHQGSFKMVLVNDCIIMRLMGGKIVEFGEDSSEYMPHPDFPIATSH